MIGPARAADMSDGWETRRRRGPGHDWAILELGARGRIVRAEVDTLHFRGNAPGHCGIDVCDAPGAGVSQIGESMWRPLLEQGKLHSHENHRFSELTPGLDATHARLRIYPDGGVSRFRLFGRTERATRALLGLSAWNQKAPAAAREFLMRCAASQAWADAVIAHRPYGCLAELFARGDRIWRDLDRKAWLEAFSAHPRIGDTSGSAWSKNEQAGVNQADADIKAALAAGNQTYEKRFGHVFLICATGKSAGEMLRALETRLKNDADTELRIAAEEQRKITHLRLFKGLCE
jgi:allantoicase